MSIDMKKWAQYRVAVFGYATPNTETFNNIILYGSFPLIVYEDTTCKLLYLGHFLIQWSTPGYFIV